MGGNHAWLFVENVTLPETNSKFAPENVWLEYYCRFLLGRLGPSSGANLLLVLGSVLPKNLGRDSLDSTTGGVKTNQQGNLS